MLYKIHPIFLVFFLCLFFLLYFYFQVFVGGFIYVLGLWKVLLCRGIKLSQDIRKKADYNRSYILNRAEGDLMMKNLRDNLLSSIDDLDDADKVKLRIVKASDKKAPTKEEINKLFKDDRASISWNPVKKEYKIISDEGNYIIEGKSAFNNVLINTINGAMSINDYLNQLSDEYYQGEGNERDILNFNKGLNYAFGTLHSYYNTVNSEATKTDKNARIGN